MIELGPIGHQPQRRTRHAERIVGVDDERHRLEDLLHLLRGAGAGGFIRAVDFGQQCCHHRRAGRGFDHLDRTALGHGHRLELLAQVHRDFMARARAIALGQQGNHQIALLRLGAQEVVPHQAVEIERRRGAGIGLHRHHFGHLAGYRRGGLQHAGGAFEAGPLGQVHHQLDLALVVEGQQLDRDRLEIEHRAGQQRGHPHGDQEALGAGLGGDHPAGVFAVKRAKLAALGILVPVIVQRLAGKADHQPGGDDHRDEERKDHRRRGVDRDRRHIGTHQPRNEQHRQQRGNHRQGGDDGGIAHLGNGLHCRVDPASAILHRPVAGDILDHHDRIIDQDADREDQREQADAVDGKAHDLAGEHGQHDGGGDDDRSNSGLAPADRKADQNHDRNRCQGEVKDQLVGLFVGGFAIVAGHRHADAVGDQPALKVLDLVHHRFGHGDSIGPGALGDGKTDRRGHGPALLPVPRPTPGAGLILAGGLGDRGDIAEQHRRAAGRAHGQPGQFLRIAQRLPGADRHGLAAFAHGSRGKGTVGLRYRLDHVTQRHAVNREPGRIGHHPQRRALAAGDEGQPDIVDLGDFAAQLARQLKQRLIAPLTRRAGLGGQRQHHDRHIGDSVDGHLRRGNPHRNAIGIGLDLFVDPGGRVLRVGADQEPRGDQHPVILGLGIDVLDPVDRLDDGFQWLGDQLDRIGRGQARRRDADIDHRHRNLRFFLARNGDGRDQPDHDRGEQEQRGQRRADRGAGDRPRNAEVHLPLFPISTSPAPTPARISILPSSGEGAV